MKSQNALFSVFLTISVLMLMNCGGPKVGDRTPPIPEKRPKGKEWVDQGGGFFKGDRGRAFYGVGGVSGMKNVSLRRTGADTQARADISRVFKSHIANLVKVYQREISDMDKSAAEALIQEATMVFTSMDLTGAQIIDRYYSVNEQTQYSLCHLNLASFEDMIEKMDTLSKQAQDMIINNAEKAFKELDDLENKK